MIRLLLILLLLLISLLAVFRAPAFPLWLLSIIVEELPWAFAGITTIVLLWGWQAERYPWVFRGAGVLAIALFLSPVMRAYRVARGLEGEMERAFGGKGDSGRPEGEEGMIGA